MNDKNLIPSNKRSEEEVKALLSMAGKKSVEVRRRKKKMRDLGANLMSMAIPPTQHEVREQMAAMGIEDADMTYAMQIIVAMIMKASKGDVNAAKFLKETCEESFEEMAEKMIDGKEEKEDVVIYLPDNGRGDLESNEKLSE